MATYPAKIHSESHVLYLAFLLSICAHLLIAFTLSNMHLTALKTRFVLTVDIIHTIIPELVAINPPLLAESLPETPKLKSNPVTKKDLSKTTEQKPPTSGEPTRIVTPSTEQKNASETPVMATEKSEIKPETTVAVAPQKIESQASKSEPTEAKNARAQYGILLSQEIAKFKQYPPFAKQSRQQGVVVVHLQIDHLGKLLASNISQSSNNELLDNQALAMVNKAAPFTKPPPDFQDKDLSLLIPISFRLN